MDIAQDLGFKIERTLLLVRLRRLCSGQHPVVAVRARHGRCDAGHRVHPGRQVDRPAHTPAQSHPVDCSHKLESLLRHTVCFRLQVTSIKRCDTLSTLASKCHGVTRTKLRRQVCMCLHGYVSAQQSACAPQHAPAVAAACARLALPLPPQPQRSPPGALASRPQHLHHARHGAARQRQPAGCQHTSE